MLTMFLEICKGVCYMHQNFFIHRDLKPKNIFLKSNEADLKPKNVFLKCNDGDEKNGGILEDLVKIGDLGTSKNLEMTMAKTKIGTELYAAPEFFLDEKLYLEFDIWSLGVILYRLITLRRPFSSQKDILQADFSKLEILDPNLLYLLEWIF